MDAFQKHYPNLNWGWTRRKWFMLRYDIGMAISRLRSYWRS